MNEQKGKEVASDVALQGCPPHTYPDPCPGLGQEELPTPAGSAQASGTGWTEEG